jgi:hypothetical protein
MLACCLSFTHIDVILKWLRWTQTCITSIVVEYVRIGSVVGVFDVTFL